MKSPRHSCGDKDWERAGDTAWEYHSCLQDKASGEKPGGKMETVRSNAPETAWDTALDRSGFPLLHHPCCKAHQADQLNSRPMTLSPPARPGTQGV